MDRGHAPDPTSVTAMIDPHPWVDADHHKQPLLYPHPTEATDAWTAEATSLGLHVALTGDPIPNPTNQVAVVVIDGERYVLEVANVERPADHPRPDLNSVDRITARREADVIGEAAMLAELATTLKHLPTPF